MNKSEAKIKNEILSECARDPSLRIFNSPTGVGFQGRVLQRTATRLILENPRVIKFGLCEGASDLIGWKSISITPDMVGKKLAVFVGVEIKTLTGRASFLQKQFLAVLKSHGGIARLARNVDQLSLEV